MFIIFKMILNKNNSSSYFAYFFLNVSITAWVFFGLLRISVLSVKFADIILVFNRLSWSLVGILFLNFIYSFLRMKKNLLFWFSTFLSSLGFFIINFTNIAFLDGYLIQYFGISALYSEDFFKIAMLNSGIPVIISFVFLIEYIFKNKIKNSIPEILILSTTTLAYILIIYFDVILPSLFYNNLSISGNLYASIFSIILYIAVKMKKQVLNNDFEYSNLLAQKIDDSIVICNNDYKIVNFNTNNVSSKIKKGFDIRKLFDNADIKHNIFVSENKYFNFKVDIKKLSFGNLNYGFAYIFKKIPLIISENEKKFEFNNVADNFSEEKYKKIFEYRKECIVMFSIDSGKIIKTNKAFRKLYGYSKKELEKINIYDLSQSKEDDFVFTKKAEFKKGPLETLYINHCKKDKTIFPVELSGYLFEFLNHNFVVSVVTDMNKISFKEKLLVNSKKKILSNRVLSSLAHEFHNTYKEIVKKTEILEKNKDNNKEFYSKIKTATIKGLEHSKILLGFSQKDNIIKEIIEVKSFVEEILILFKSKNSNKNIDVEICIVKNKFLKMFPGDLRKILLILLQNAEHAVMENENPKIKISLEYNKDLISIYVEDNGRGISEKDLKNIFLPFYSKKGEFAEKDDIWHNIEGNGLGLAVASVIASEYNAKIDVDWTSDLGSRFVFTIPVTGN
ncbi:MAG: PAS domain-containing sensor histidine kinase [Candidatus Muirbacterium halophilum]|nr:PAS domain-containing sensor histidine kinase [Candidatus Muirbacterium halophilum]